MLVIHHNDLDGRCGAAVVRWSMPRQERDAIEFLEMDYTDPIDIGAIVLKHREVWIVDFSLRDWAMERLIEEEVLVHWIDHHKTAIENAKGKAWENVAGIRSTDWAACVLAWQYTQPDQRVPRGVELIGDRDAWHWQYGEETKLLCAGLMAYDTSPGARIWDDVFSDDLASIEDVFEAGQVIERYREQSRAGMVKQWGWIGRLTWHGVVLRCLCLNKPRAGSEAFGPGGLDEYDLLVSYGHDGLKWVVSLYSSSVDVSEIAVAFGGGGHKGAVGFEMHGTEVFPFVPVYDLVATGGIRVVRP